VTAPGGETGLAMERGGAERASVPDTCWGKATAIDDSIDGIMDYALHIRCLRAPELKLLNTATGRRMHSTASRFDRLRRGLLLSLADTEFFDARAARSLMTEYLEAAADHTGEMPLRTFVKLQIAMLDESAAARARLSDEQDQRKALALKLNKLKAIEQQINDRENIEELPGHDER
jgi:hypothetical protein